MIKHLLPLLVSLFLPLPVAFGQYAQWRHRGPLVVLTTPDGANLPPSAREEGFPLLVRLNRETFDFSQARADGADLRFSADGQPLAYQIEQWDPAGGEASVWVRMPVVRGNARQEFTLHWGQSDASSESNGQAVFNESNGYAVVMHLAAADPVKDEVGTVSPTDRGTTACAGAIGRGRRFEPGQGIACGEKIAGLPNGAGPCTTEAWFQAERVNGIVVGWGNEQAQGKAIMEVRSPPHVRMDCYFSSANVASEGRLPLGAWVHVVHACQAGDSRIYVNGQLAGSASGRQSLLNVRSPARMWLGGWYNNYRFAGDVDEVRISRVARSADWVKLAYENQKPQQTLVGTLAQPGTTLAVSPETISIEEGRSVTVTAQAGGAEKVSWILRRGDQETILSTDRFACTLDAGRVTGDTSCLLRFKAVYPQEVRTKDIPVMIRDTVPEPRFELAAPAAWNGRDTIEVVPRFSNLAAMQAAGAGEMHYRWDVSGGAVLKQVAAGRLILSRSQFTGPIRVTARVDNGGAEAVQTATIEVAEPQTEPWIERTPAADEQPEEGQFYARDDRNQGTLHYNGTLDRPADSVFLKVFADDQPYHVETRPLTADRQYALTAKLKPGLVKYRVEFGSISSGQEQVLARVGGLVCGDAYLIDGQSNALATDTREDAPRETSEWIRSYGGPAGRGDGTEWVRARTKAAERAGLPRPNLWCRPVWKANRPEHQAELGW